MAVPAPADLIDLGRYPITSPGGAAAAALVRDCRARLAELGCCELGGFLTPAAVELVVRETAEIADLAHHAAGPVQPYLEPADPTLPEGHPRRHLGRSSVAAIAYDLFPPSHALRRLYEWDLLMGFLAAALVEPRLYRYADPLGALNVAVMRDGDELGWHFDQTDFVTSIALRDAESGGDFEYAANIRSAGDENYGAVRELLEGSGARVRRVPMTPGTLLLFKGRHSIHRVTPVRGKTSRLVALLAYDTRPGTVSSELLRYSRYGRNTARSPGLDAH